MYTKNWFKMLSCVFFKLVYWNVFYNSYLLVIISHINVVISSFVYKLLGIFKRIYAIYAKYARLSNGNLRPKLSKMLVHFFNGHRNIQNVNRLYSIYGVCAWWFKLALSTRLLAAHRALTTTIFRSRWY